MNNNAEQNQNVLAAFDDPDHVARYAEGPPRFVPGLAGLHRMTGVLLAEKAPENAHVLVLGAGGGLELKALAEAHPGWTFAGVDPSEEMLGLAEATLGPLAARVRFHAGFIDDAPEGPFDAATCLLTLHFLDAEERRKTLEEIRRRLKLGAPLVAAHCSFPQADEDARKTWLARYAAFAIASGADIADVEKAREMVDAALHLFEPEVDAAIIKDAGFVNVAEFYAAFTWRGWAAYAP